MLKVSELDEKILKVLLQDGRKGFVDIARECGKTKDKIWKHYKAMEKKRIITGATIQLNFSLLGFDALATLLIDVDAKQIHSMMRYIDKIPEVHAYRQYNTVYSIRAVTALKDLNQLDHVKEIIRNRLPTAGLKTFISTDVKNTPENLQLTSRNSGLQNVKPTKKPLNPQAKYHIDDLDAGIIDELKMNGRMTFTSIAKKIGTSTDTVVKRYQKLRENRIIRATIQIDPTKLGYSAILDFQIALAHQSDSLSAVDSLAKIPNVTTIAKTSGDYDLQLSAMIKNTQQMFTLQDRILRTPGVMKMELSARKIPNRWPATSLMHLHVSG